jgi:MFS family permease
MTIWENATGVGIVSVLFVRYLFGRTPSGSLEGAGLELRFLKWSFLAIWALVKFSDWLQGPFFHQVYANLRDEHGQPVLTPALLRVVWLTGFASSGVFAFVGGVLADRFGRRTACALCCACYCMSLVLTHFPSVQAAMASRVFSGVASCLLHSAFEGWINGVARKHVPKEEDLQRFLKDVMSWRYLLDGFTAVVAGVTGDLIRGWLGSAKSVFDFAAILYVVGFLLVVAVFEDDRKLLEQLPAAPARLKARPSDGDGVTPAAKDADPVFHWGTGVKIVLLGFCQAAFEGSMYAFVLLWVPCLWKGATASLQRASESGIPLVLAPLAGKNSSAAEMARAPDPNLVDWFPWLLESNRTLHQQVHRLVTDWDPSFHWLPSWFARLDTAFATMAVSPQVGNTSGLQEIPLGAVFSVMMVALMAGSTLFAIVSTKTHLDNAVLLSGSHLVGASALGLMAFAPLEISTVTLGLVLFEGACGFHFASSAAVRGAVLPPRYYASITAGFRVPLNALVIAIILSLDSIGPDSALLFCALLCVASCVVSALFLRHAPSSTSSSTVPATAAPPPNTTAPSEHVVPQEDTPVATATRQRHTAHSS